MTLSGEKGFGPSSESVRHDFPASCILRPFGGWTNCDGPDVDRQGDASSVCVPTSDRVRPARVSRNLQKLIEVGRLDGFTRSIFRGFGFGRSYFLRCMRQDADRDSRGTASRGGSAADDCVYDGLRDGQRCSCGMQGRDCGDRAGCAVDGYHASGDAVSDRRGSAISGGRYALLSFRHDFSCGRGSRSGDVAKGRNREIEEGAVFCAAGQWSDYAGDRARWIGLGAGNYEHGLDAAAASVFDVSWTGHFFAGGGASCRRDGTSQWLGQSFRNWCS